MIYKKQISKQSIHIVYTYLIIQTDTILMSPQTNHIVALTRANTPTCWQNAQLLAFKIRSTAASNRTKDPSYIVLLKSHSIYHGIAAVNDSKAHPTRYNTYNLRFYT